MLHNVAKSHKIRDEEDLENFTLDSVSDSDDSCILLADERDTVVPRKLFCLSPEPSDSNGSAGQEIQEPLLVRLPEDSSSDGTVQQEVQDVEVDPLSDAQPELSGTTSGDDVSQVTMEKLPDEILQEIFALQPAQIVADPDDEKAGVVLHQQPVQPALDLANEEAGEDVVPEAITWKKLYLEEVDNASQIVTLILQRYGLTEPDQCMLGFIRCVAAVRTCHCEDPTAALTCLQGHSLYPKAEVCIARRLPDLDGHKERPAYIRAVMAAIVLFAGGVCDIQELMDCLQSLSFPMSPRDILEILYSMATLFYAMWEKEVQISNRFHYSVSYCLHYLENSLCSTPSINDPELPSSGIGPRLLSHPTSEQQRILNHTLNAGDRVKIVGLAGTGKTSTLLQYATDRPELKFLYLAFNKSIIQQAGRVFHENVTKITFHALAKNAVGNSYELIEDIKTNEVGRVLSNREASATMVVQTLKAFFVSTDESIKVEHVGKNVEERIKQIIVEEAKQIWAMMKALGPAEGVAHRMTHDSYLKLWQLQKPSLSEYDIILVDEAQDCSPAMMSIVLLQKCPVILVGNPDQQIYTFRGADNTVLDVHNSRNFDLTQNFRCGYEIAYVGATLLDVSRKIRKIMVGNYRASVVSEEGKEAWLSRTNRAVFDNAVKVTDRYPSRKIHFLGDPDAVGLDIIEDLWKVKHSEFGNLKTQLIKEYVQKGFRSIKSIKNLDKKLLTKIGILNHYDERVLELVNRIRQCHVWDPESADYILGTVHKAKGMEFDTVKIDDEFMTKLNLERLRSNRIETIPADDWNLLYVAVTRAKKRLILPTFFARILKVAKEYCVRFELSTTLCNTTPPDCVQCRREVPIPRYPVLIPKRIKYPDIQVDDTETRKGFLCPSCAESELGPIAQLAGYSKMEQVAACLPENIEVPSEVHTLLEDF